MPIVMFGLMAIESVGKNRYLVIFIEDFSRCCSVYFLQCKSECLRNKEFEALVTNYIGGAIGAFCSV